MTKQTGKRFWIYRIDGETGVRTRVGSGSKTEAKATALRHRMRAQQPLGSSTWFTLPELVRSRWA